jgi:hypothetical protein
MKLQGARSSLTRTRHIMELHWGLSEEDQVERVLSLRHLLV